MSGSPRPDWQTGGQPGVADQAAAPSAPARPAAVQGAVVQPDRPQPADADRPVRRPDLDALCAGGPLRFGGGGDRGGRRDRRAGRPAGAAAERHAPLRRGIRQPGGLPVLRRRAGVHAVSLVAAARRRLRLHALPDVRGLHGAAAGAVQRLARWRAWPAYAYNFFTGVPGAGRRGAGAVPAVPWAGGQIGRSGTGCWRAAQYPLFCAVVLVGTALLLVSTLPIWSFKNFKVPHEYVLPLLLGAGTFAAVLVADPWARIGRRRRDLSRACCRSASAASAACAARPWPGERPWRPTHRSLVAIAPRRTTASPHRAAKLARRPAADRPRVISTIRWAFKLHRARQKYRRMQHMMHALQHDRPRLAV